MFTQSIDSIDRSIKIHKRSESEGERGSSALFDNSYSRGGDLRMGYT